jgi:bacterioferritin-associated ferredoxin
MTPCKIVPATATEEQVEAGARITFRNARSGAMPWGDAWKDYAQENQDTYAAMISASPAYEITEEDVADATEQVRQAVGCSDDHCSTCDETARSILDAFVRRLGGAPNPPVMTAKKIKEMAERPEVKAAILEGGRWSRLDGAEPKKGD